MKRFDCIFNIKDDTYRVQQALDHGDIIEGLELYITKPIKITTQTKGKLINCNINCSNGGGFHWINDNPGTVWNVKVEDYMYACIVSQT